MALNERVEERNSLLKVEEMGDCGACQPRVTSRGMNHIRLYSSLVLFVNVADSSIKQAISGLGIRCCTLSHR
jgi:hypothetical protein